MSRAGRLGAGIVARAPALAEADFRRYFFAQIGSVLGTFIQAVAMSWMVYRITDSAALLGLTAFLSQAPQLVVAPLAGVLVDRFDRRRILIALQSLFALQALVLATLVAFDAIAVWHLLTLSLLLGVLNSFDLPSRQSLLIYLLQDRANLANAVALNAAVVHSGRLLGPPLGGLILAVLPESLCFLLNALSYLGPIYAVWALRVTIPRQSELKAVSALREVAAFFRRHREARLAMLAVASVNVTASSYVVLMPVYARDLFNGDARTLGLLLGMAGGGALLASVYLSTRSRSTISLAFTFAAGLVAAFGLGGLTLAGVVASQALALPMVALIGAGIGATNIAGNTRLQYLVPDGLRGRVIAVFGALRFGFDAIGGLVAGALTVAFGILPVTAGLAMALAASGVLLIVRGALRPARR